MLKKLFGGKKGEFYAQIDESQEAATTETAVPVEASTEEFATTVVAAETTEVASTEVSKGKSKSKGKTKSVETTESAAPVAVKVPEAEVPFWVTAMRSTAAIQAETKSEMTFSTDYLLSSGSSSRRRPGPSLNAFKEIARQVKKPIN